MLEKRFQVDVFADYHQFYLLYPGENPPIPENWSDHDVERRAKVADHLVVICPVRNTAVPVVVEIHDSEPAIDLASYDHVVQCSISLPTGELQLLGCTGGEVLRQSVPPGMYRLLALYSGLGTLDASGLYGQDTYRILLSPAPALRPLSVLKVWP